MIDNDKTKEKFGYTADELGKSAKREVCVICDYCGDLYIAINGNRNKSLKSIPKDACNKCKYVKRREVSLVKYGVENSAQRPEVRDKIRQTNIDMLRSDEFKEKSRQTMISRYGCEHALHSAEIKERAKSTVMGRYGVDNVSKNEDFKEKRRNTNLERYGAKEFLSSKYARDTIKKTNLIKYGVENVFQLEKNKMKGDKHHLKNKDKANENARKALSTKIKNGKIRMYNGKTISELREKHSKYSDSRFRHMVNEFGMEEALKMSPYKSYLESKMCSWLDSIGVEYKTGQRIGSYRPDIVIGDLVIELDGLYWHSDAICKNNKYHYNKKEYYTNNGYRSCFFREDEVNNKFEIVKSIILNKIGQSKKIYARKCEHVKANKEFIRGNHLMGGGSGDIMGLSYEGEVVAAIQIKRIRDNDYEISRFCTKGGISVVGGYSKLMNKFIEENRPDRIVTFIDLRYGEGSYLTKIGYTFHTCYCSFKWTNTRETFHRMKFRSNTGYESGLYKIWDCGQAKYIHECV